MTTQPIPVKKPFNKSVMIALIIAGLMTLFFFGSFFILAMTRAGGGTKDKGFLSTLFADPFGIEKEGMQQRECDKNRTEIELMKYQYAIQKGLPLGADISFSQIGPDSLRYLKKWPVCPASANASAAVRNQGLTEHDYDIGAIGYAAKCRNHPKSDYTLWYVGAGWATHDSEAVAKWGLQQSEEQVMKIGHYHPKFDKAKGSHVLIPADWLAEFENVTTTWVRNNPEVATQWVRALPAGEGRDSALKRVAVALVGSNPAVAYELVKLLTERVTHFSACEDVGNKYAAADLESAAKFALQMPDGQARRLLISSVASKWGEKDPAAAAKWERVAEVRSGNDPKSRDQDPDAADEGASDQQRKDSEAAAKSALQLPEGRGRILAIQSVTEHWARKDPVAAAKWALQLQDKEGLNIAVQAVCVTNQTGTLNLSRGKGVI